MSEVVFDGQNCKLSLERLSPQVVLMRIAGRDVGEHGDRPMQALAEMLAGGAPVELFIDARLALGPSTDVSAAWARWLGKNRAQFTRANMLTGSRFVQLTAEFVRKFADLADVMRIYTDPVAFETALSLAVAA